MVALVFLTRIAKNLVLAGVGSLTILDSAVVTEADLGAQFFLADGGDANSLIGRNRAHAALYREITLHLLQYEPV
jgi:molybdopterin/thiamine biosynthesis adenylyltransferase